MHAVEIIDYRGNWIVVNYKHSLSAKQNLHYMQYTGENSVKRVPRPKYYS